MEPRGRPQPKKNADMFSRPASLPGRRTKIATAYHLWHTRAGWYVLIGTKIAFDTFHTSKNDIFQGVNRAMNANLEGPQDLASSERINGVQNDSSDRTGRVHLTRGFGQFFTGYFLPSVFLLLFLIVGVSTASAQNRAYVTNIAAGTVSVIDTATNTEIAVIPVGSQPIAVAILPNGTRAYVANQNSASVSVINTATNMVIATIPVGEGPSGVAVSPNGLRVYVTNQGDDNVSVINTLTNTVIGTIPVGVAPFGVKFNTAGTRAYVTNRLSGSVSVIDTASLTVVATIQVGSIPWAVVLNTAGTRAYVANGGDNTVSVIDTTTNTVIATISVMNDPIAIAISPDGTRVYVANQESHSVSVIDTTTNTVINTVIVGAFPSGIAVGPGGTFIYVTNQGSGTVSVIDSATLAVVANIPTTGACPFGIAVIDTTTGGGTTAADVTITGRVARADGRGIGRVYVTLSGGGLAEPLYALTNPFGYYRFDGVESGETYVLSVTAKRYRFADPQRVLNLDDSIANVDFIAQP